MTKNLRRATYFISYLLIVALGFATAVMIVGKNRAFDPRRVTSIYYVFMGVPAGLKRRVPVWWAGCKKWMSLGAYEAEIYPEKELIFVDGWPSGLISLNS